MNAPQLTPAVHERVARLLLLMLGTDQDGEALAARLALTRTLRAAGADMHVLAREIESPAPRSTFHEDAHPSDWRAKLKICLDHKHFLSSWECGFLESMCKWTGQPTVKQADRLDAIFNKVQVRAEAAP